ncbi:hypothetical protein [Actinokineospora sp. HUAS TT18]|uniref:hypothetical protein n=1 Tax=Actinokineospora sp. HUAS TT18 TaxID=3447451 RepID=UPI003F5215BC
MTVALPATASAAPEAWAWVDSAGLHYQGGDGANSGKVEFVNGSLKIHDSVGIAAGAGCQSVSSTQVSCGGMKPLQLDLGANRDSFILNVPGAQGYIQMGSGDDTLYVGAAYYSGAASAMAIQGGGGTSDILTYELSNRGVYGTMDGIANDGRGIDSGLCVTPDSADRDNIHPSFETLRGSRFDDTLSGRDNSPDQMDGGRGSDCLYGRSGDDVFKEGSQADETDQFFGMDGFDTLDYSTRTETVRALGKFSGGGDQNEWNESYFVERVIGGFGNDNFQVMLLPQSPGGHTVNEFYGGPGNDTLIGDGYANKLYGGSGVDYLEGRAGADFLNCGTDNDTVRLPEASDTVTSCEIYS